MPLTPCQACEIPAIADLVNSAYRDRSGQGWTSEADYLEGARTSAADLTRDLAAQPNARLLAFRDEGEAEILGCVWLEPAGEGTWYLGMLTIRPDLQDRRLGRSLLDAAEAAAAELGARRIRMTVVNVRDSLIAWYQRRGYRPTGEVLPFPYEGEPFGRPKRDDLAFVVLEKPL